MSPFVEQIERLAAEVKRMVEQSDCGFSWRQLIYFNSDSPMRGFSEMSVDLTEKIQGLICA